MKTILTAILAITFYTAIAQTNSKRSFPDSAVIFNRDILTNIDTLLAYQTVCRAFQSFENGADTVKVYGAYLDTAELVLKWIKIYAVLKFDKWGNGTNGIVALFDEYLMPDKKTPVKFKVIFSINR